MVGKTRIIILLAGICFTLASQAQNFTRHNWYFTNNDQALVFGKEENARPILDAGKVAQANIGEKLTATDPTSGDLLFYSDGINIYDASHQIMQNGDGILSDPNGVQAMSVAPVPGIGSENLYYLLHRDDAGRVFYTIVNMGLQGNRADGPPAGQVPAGQKNVPTGIIDRGDGMITLASNDMTTFWLVTQNSTNLNFELHEIPPFDAGGATFPDTGAPLNLTASVEASHLAYHPGSSRIAIVPRNDANIQIVDFNQATPELVSDRAINNSFVPSETFGGSAGWSFDGSKLFFSRNTATDGNLYRIDLIDDLASVEPVFSTPLGQSQSLLLAPDSTVYHIYRETVGGDQLIGRINQPDSAITNLDYESALFEGEAMGSDYFTQFTPDRNLMPMVEISIQAGDICMNNPIQFFSEFNPPTAQPTDFRWDFQPLGLTSDQRAPIMSFEEAGMLTATLTVDINGRPVTSNVVMADILENDLQVQLMDTTICPGETLELDAEPQDGGQGQQGGASGGPYTYLWNTGETSAQINVTEAGNYWVVVTPTTGCPVYATAAVEVYGDENPTANIWYFGNGAGIDFNEEDGLPPPPRSIASAHAMDAPEGTATISDTNGDVLFYTDGRSVWNSFDNKMPNGTEIGGDSTSTQSVLIVPFQDDDTQYYVFTTQEVYGIDSFLMKYSVIDMKEDDGRGDVIEKDIVLFARSTEKLIAYQGGNGYWVMAHEYGNNTFRAYPVTAEGIGAPVLSSAGSVHSINDPFSGQASMKFSGDGERIAVALVEGSDDYVEIFDFDPETGEVVELEYQIDLNEGGGSTTDQVYDVHFSNGGVKLFASMNNRNTGAPGGRILEYRVDTLSTPDSRLASRTDIAAGSANGLNIGAMQTGPDGQIYVAVEVPGTPTASQFVGGIAANEDTAGVSAFTQQQVILTAGNSRLGLPNFVQNQSTPQDQPSFSAPDTTCTEQRIELTGSGTSDIDMYNWSIVEEATSTVLFNSVAAEPDTAFTFPAGTPEGRYNISLNIFNRCGFDTTFTQTLDLFDTPAPPTIPSALAICEGQTNMLDANAMGLTGLTYEWTNSQGTVVSTTSQFTVSEPEIYTVTITNAGGCTSSGQVFAGPPFEIQLPPNQTICEGDALELDPQVTASNYIWTVINPDNSTTTLPNQQRATVDSSVPGVYNYVVSIEDPITPGCFVNDTTVVTVNAIPQATQGTTNAATCGNADGSFDYSVTTTGSYTVQIVNNAGTVVSNEPGFTGPGTSSATNLEAGVYTINMIDNSSGCTNSLGDIVIDNAPADFAITGTVAAPADCDNPTGSITVSLDSDVFPVNYTLSDADGNTVTGSAATFIGGTTFDFLIDNLPSGIWDLEVSSSGGCVQTATNIDISAPADVNLTLEPNFDVCGTEVLLVATSTSPGATLNWTGPGGFTGSTTSGQTLSTTVNGTYTVVASAPGLCDVTQTTEVALAIQPVVQINEVGDNCSGSQTLEAEVTNPQTGVSYVYSWDTGDGTTVIGTTASITVTEDNTYRVTVRESGNLTCTGTASLAATVPLQLEGTLTSTPPCEDEQPITLTYTPADNSGTPTGFTWSFNGNTIPGGGSSITINDEGTYTVRATAGACFIERSLEIRRFAIPPSTLPERILFCPRAEPTIVDGGRGFATYEWALDGQVLTDETEQTLSVMAAGIYTVTMTTTQGCQRIANMEVVESCDPVIVAPTALIPTGTAPNNTFSIVPNEFVNNFEIFIYSRWGELIYQSNSLEFKWDGTTGGEPVPGGTYAYIMKFTSVTEPERGVFEQTGSITVIR